MISLNAKTIGTILSALDEGQKWAQHCADITKPPIQGSARKAVKTIGAAMKQLADEAMK